MTSWEHYNLQNLEHSTKRQLFTRNHHYHTGPHGRKIVPWQDHWHQVGHNASSVYLNRWARKRGEIWTNLKKGENLGTKNGHNFRTSMCCITIFLAMSSWPHILHIQTTHLSHDSESHIQALQVMWTLWPPKSGTFHKALTIYAGLGYPGHDGMKLVKV